MTLLTIWTIAGFFLVLLLPQPKNKLFALLQLFLGGPIAWALFIYCSIQVFLERKS